MASLYEKCGGCGNMWAPNNIRDHKHENEGQLKRKLLVRPFSKGGPTKQRTDNSHGPKKYRKSTKKVRPRKRAYGPF